MSGYYVTVPPAEEESDASLVRWACSGNAEAFARLAVRHLGLVMSILSEMPAARREREDLCQEVLLKARRELRNLREPGRFAAWLASIARNEARQCLRTLSRHPRTVAQLPDLPALPASDPLEEEERRQALRRALRELPDETHQLVLWRVAENLPFAAIALRLDITEETARQRYARALHELRQRLQPVKGGEDA